MTRILFHIGQYKTGSTAIQHCLTSNRTRFRKNGILYPRLPGWRSAHHALFPHFFGVEYCSPYILRRLGSDASKSLDASRDAWDRLRESVAKQKPKQLILSSEVFFTAGYEAQMHRLGNILREISDEIEVVCYVRNPAEFLLSSYGTQIQVDMGFQWPPPGLRKEVLQAYEHVSPGKLHVMKYSRECLQGGDITQDFCGRFLGEQPSLSTAKRVNESMSAEALIVMERYVRANKASRDKAMPFSQQVFRRLLKRVDRFVSGFEKAKLLPVAQASILNACTDLTWLNSQHDISWKYETEASDNSSSDLVYGGDLSASKICKFDPDRVRKLERIMSPWY